MLDAKAVRRRKRAGKLTPVAVRRSLHADRWLSRYYVVVKRELDRMAREVAAHARAGFPRDVARSTQMTWAERLVHAKERWVYAVAQNGWDLAGTELTYQAGKFKSAPPGGIYAKAVEVGLTPEDFLVAGDFEGIDRWVETTSLAEVETEAEDLAKVWKAAEESRDPETGRAWTNKQIADEISRKGLAKNVHRANLLARTGTIWAINEGAQQRYAAAGVPAMEWQVTEDDLLCPWCFQMDGRVVRTEDPFWKRGSEFGAQVPLKGGGSRLRSLKLPFDVQHPPLHPYCLVGETPVFAPDKVAGFVSTYSGPVVEITFSGSRRLTVTPNHMLATPQGFARAASLRKGDDVVDGLALQRIVCGDVDDDRQPTSIHDVVKALAKSPGMSTTTVPVSAEYLHGDAALCHGEINVVAPDCLLRRDGEAAPPEHAFEPSLLGADVCLALLDRGGDSTSVFLRAMGSAAAWWSAFLSAFSGCLSDGSMCGPCECEPFLSRESRHSKLVRLADGTYADAAFDKAKANGRSSDTEPLGEGQFGLPFKIPTANIVRLRIVQHSCGHVYDLQSLSGLYLANGILSSNCRCTMLPVITESQARNILPPTAPPRIVPTRAGVPRL